MGVLEYARSRENAAYSLLERELWGFGLNRHLCSHLVRSDLPERFKQLPQALWSNPQTFRAWLTRAQCLSRPDVCILVAAQRDRLAGRLARPSLRASSDNIPGSSWFYGVLQFCPGRACVSGSSGEGWVPRLAWLVPPDLPGSGQPLCALWGARSAALPGAKHQKAEKKESISRRR